MVTLFLAVFLPMSVMLAAGFAVRGYKKKVEYPRPLILGCMIPKACPVHYEEILYDIDVLDSEVIPVEGRLRREAQRKAFRLNWLHICEEAADTILFLQALRFEELRIKPEKSGMNYEDSEVVAVQLLEETVQLRWKQVRCQMSLILRAELGLRINKEVFKALLEDYKQLEEQFVHFVGMKNEDYQKMLIDRLGLGGWGMMNGGNS